MRGFPALLTNLSVENGDEGGCMMKTIVEEKLVSFKTLEQKIYKFICAYGAELTRIILEKNDDELAEGRDRKVYRDKGKRITTGSSTLVTR